MVNQAIRRAAWLAALSLAAAPAVAAEREPGVLWEHTIEMQMQGFSMPAQTNTFCAPKKGLQEPPGARQDDKCQVKDFRRAGNRMTWKMVCTDPEPMTGEAELVYGPRSYDGKMTMTSSRGEVRAKLRGKLLGDPCDAGEVKRQAAAIQEQQQEAQAQHEQSVAQGCQESVRSMNVMALASPFCKDPKYKAEFCARLSTREGFLAAEESRSVEKGCELCGKDANEIIAKLCPATLKEVQASRTAPAAPKDAQRKRPAALKAVKRSASALQPAQGGASRGDALRFLGRRCPAETNELGKLECAGRSYTGANGPDEAYREFCTEYARDMLGSGRAQPAAAEPKVDPKKAVQEGAVEAGKEKLKGMFGF